MVIPKALDFSNVTTEKILLSNTKQYKLLNKLANDNWKEYCNKMLSKGTSVIYDAEVDAFIVKPIKENKMPINKSYLEDEIDLDSDVSNLFEPEVEDTIEEVPSSGMVSMEELKRVLSELLTSSSSEIAQSSNLTPPTTSQLTGSEEDLYAVYGQTEEGVLGSEFEANNSRVEDIDNKINSEESYVDKIGGLLSQLEADVDAEDVTEILPAQEPEEVEDDFSIEEPFETEEDFDWEDSEDLESPEEEFVDDEEVEEEPTELLDSDDEDEDFLEEDEMDGITPDITTPAINTNKTMNLSGMPVKIILTGVMITSEELGYIGESFKKAGMKLKTIEGKGKKLSMVLEYANKQYTINYEDLPSRKTLTPFKIKNLAFKNLDEAIERIKLPLENRTKELKNFKSIVGKDVINRQLSNIKESTILKDFEGKLDNYVKGWNVKSVGMVNLKTGINEVYSNITEHTEEKNTLLKTTDGQYFLMKGNLKERSEIGEKRQISDIQGKKDYGTATVIGIYENNSKGLGQIMYKTKRTSLPLLIWK